MPDAGDQLSYALQLCCLRFPGRCLSHGELLPGIMVDHIADQVQADADVTLSRGDVVILDNLAVHKSKRAAQARTFDTLSKALGSICNLQSSRMLELLQAAGYASC